MAKKLFSFLAEQASSLVLKRGAELLVEGVGIEQAFRGANAPWLGQPVPAREALGSIDLPPGCSWDGGDLVVDLYEVAQAHGGSLDPTFFWADAPGEVHPIPRQGPLLTQRVEAEILLPPALTQASTPTAASVAVGVGWPDDEAAARAYFGSAVVYAAGGLAANSVVAGSFGSGSLTQLLDAGLAGGKVQLVAELGHQLATPGALPQLASEVHQIQSGNVGGPYDARVTQDVAAALHQSWQSQFVLVEPRAYLQLYAPADWEQNQPIRIRSFGVR